MIRWMLGGTLVVSTMWAQTTEERLDRLERQLQYYGEMEQIVDGIEKKSLQDKLNLNSELRFRVDNFSYHLSKLTTDREKAGLSEVDRDAVEGNPFKKQYQPHYATMLRLNFTADVEENGKFFARMVASRNSQNNERLCILSRNVSAQSQNVPTAFDFDRAYFDLKLYDREKSKLFFSAGILPTSGGSSSHIIEDTSRKSMFPSLMFDSNVMGAIVTADLSGSVSVEKSFIRAIAGKAFTLNEGQFYYQCNRETIQNMDVAGVFAETRLPLLGENMLYAGVNRAGQIKATPYLGSSSVSIDLKNLKPMGDITNSGMGFEVMDIGWGTDLFFHVSLSHPEPSGNRIDFTDTNPLLAANYYTNASYARGSLIDKDGHAYYAGVRHTFGPRLKAGAEYNRGSQYWWSATQGSEDVFNKLATRGHAVEGYVNYTFSRVLSLRAGALNIHEEYTGSGWHFGEPAPKDGVQRNYYLIVSARF